MIETEAQAMPQLDDNAIRVVKVLEEHRVLDHLQVAAFAELSVTEALSAVRQLREIGLLTSHNGDGSDDVYSLDSEALARWQSQRVREAQPA